MSRLKTRLGALGGRKSVFSMLTYKTLFLVVIIGLSPISMSPLYCSKDNYKHVIRSDILHWDLITTRARSLD